MKTRLSQITLIILMLSISVVAQDSTTISLMDELPEVVISTLDKSQFFDDYEINSAASPFYQNADFNGDGATDIAIQIVRKSSGKRGVVILHAHNPEYYLIGAGKSFATLGTDFDWLTGWRIDSFTRISEGIEGLILEHPDFPKSLVYFDGQSYQFQSSDVAPNYSVGPTFGQDIPQLLLRLPGMFPNINL